MATGTILTYLNIATRVPGLPNLNRTFCYAGVHGRSQCRRRPIVISEHTFAAARGSELGVPGYPVAAPFVCGETAEARPVGRRAAHFVRSW
eukprot:3228459-Rhodomonas_salina.1